MQFKIFKSNFGIVSDDFDSHSVGDHSLPHGLRPPDRPITTIQLCLTLYVVTNFRRSIKF